MCRYIAKQTIPLTGTNWMQLDKEITDTYLNEEYVEHRNRLKVKGFTEVEDLTDQEQQEVESAIQRLLVTEIDIF